MRWLIEQLECSFSSSAGGAVERLVFPTTSSAEIVAALSVACEQRFGAGLDDGFLYNVSVGCVFGCRLVDGREIVIKAYQPRWTPRFLRGVRNVQRQLHGSGFPLPEPIGDVFSVGPAPAVAEGVVPDPGPTPLDSETLTASATGLADQIARCRDLHEPALADNPLQGPLEGVFPAPHSPIFDFAATADGAAWIEDIGARARATRDDVASRSVIAHTDWSLRNIRIRDGRLAAVYDADSLALVPEHIALGQAAATWHNDGEGSTAPPQPAELHRYVDAYGAARGRPITDEERRGAIAAAVWNLAYIARCEHALDPDERSFPGTRLWLRAHADEVLDR